MTIETQNHGPITADDVRSALGEVDPNSTNASTLRKLLGRGSLSTIQRHLDAIRFELAAPALMEADEATQALIHQQKLAMDQKDEDMQLLAYARSEVQAQAETIAWLQEELDLQLQRSAQERESEKIRTGAVETTLRGELDRHVSQLADLRAMFGRSNKTEQ